MTRRRYASAFALSIGAHAALAAWYAWPLLTMARGDGAPAETTTQVVLLPPNEDVNYPGLKPLNPRDAEWQPDPIPEGEQFEIADLQRIGGHYQVLFPFVSPGLAVDAFFPTLATTPHLVFINPFAPKDDPGATERRRRLDLSRQALQDLVDKSWSRANRWQAFGPIRELAVNTDAADDSLAQLVGLYREQNALQPYADGAIRDLRLWAQLGLAADHASFIAFIRQYSAAHPSTKVTTELLFLLDTIVQANEDALAVLVETNQPEDLQWTRNANPRAYLLARQIERHYARALVKRGLTTRAGVQAYHGDVRLEILNGIIRTTPAGYRVNDARYLMGTILWQQSRRDDALRVWRGLTAAADSVYADSIDRIRAAVQGASVNPRTIDLILRNEVGRWLAFSDERLRRFGYRFDTF